VKPPVLPAWLRPADSGLSAYADALSTDGVTQGLIGPREAERIWTRHLLNCAVVADPAGGLVPAGSVVADVGSGAGLPGIVWAIARPDVSVVCVEPLLRRATFLSAVTEQLGLTNVTVLRERAEQSTLQASIVTARAVAPLAKLLGWTVPLLGAGGRLIAFKGSSAAEEIADAEATRTQLGLDVLSIVECGVGIVDPPTIVVTAVRQNAARA
jgi:16S rRNA (guanine527-N7)-methyltransferase